MIHVTPLEFIQIQGAIKLQPWTSRGTPYDCGQIYGLINALASKYFVVGDDKYKTQSVAWFEKHLRQLAAFVDQFPPLSLHKLHYLFVVYLFGRHLYRFNVFGGFVRDLYTDDVPADMDIWMSHHLDHKEFARDCRQLGYEVHWLDQDNNYRKKPAPRRADYGRHLGSYRLVIDGYQDRLVFDISLCGTLEQLGVDYGCNALYIERDLTVGIRATIMLPAAKYDVTYNKAGPSNTITLPTYHDESIIEFTDMVPLPFIGYEPHTKTPRLTYEDGWYTEPLLHREVQRVYASGDLLQMIPNKGIHLDSFRATYAEMPRYRMPNAEDMKLIMDDIQARVARVVTWGYVEEAAHRREKMVGKGYRLVE